MSQNENFTIHHLLSGSYTIYLVGFLIGIFLEILFPLRIHAVPITGFIQIVIATVLIVWAQNTGNKIVLNKLEKPHINMFAHGPYAFMQSPTHFGLTMLMFGFGFVAGMPFIVITAFLSFLIVHLFVLKHEEKIMEKKYGHEYSSYKKSINSKRQI